MVDTNISVQLSPLHKVVDAEWSRATNEASPRALASGHASLGCSQFHVAVSIVAGLPTKKLPGPPDSMLPMSFLTRRAFPKHLRGLHSFALFKTHHILLTSHLPKRLPKLDVHTFDYLEAFDCKLAKEAFDDICNDFQAYKAARDAFTKAVEELLSMVSELTPYGFQSNQTRIRTLLDFIEACLRAADLGHLYGWYHEKQAGIREDFEDLIRRKQASHPNYRRAQEYIRSNLLSYQPPECWQERPPSGHVV
jgi:hypothetical protein